MLPLPVIHCISNKHNKRINFKFNHMERWWLTSKITIRYCGNDEQLNIKHRDHLFIVLRQAFSCELVKFYNIGIGYFFVHILECPLPISKLSLTNNKIHTLEASSEIKNFPYEYINILNRHILMVDVMLSKMARYSSTMLCI